MISAIRTITAVADILDNVTMFKRTTELGSMTSAKMRSIFSDQHPLTREATTDTPANVFDRAGIQDSMVTAPRLDGRARAFEGDAHRISLKNKPGLSRHQKSPPVDLPSHHSTVPSPIIEIISVRQFSDLIASSLTSIIKCELPLHR